MFRLPDAWVLDFWPADDGTDHPPRPPAHVDEHR